MIRARGVRLGQRMRASQPDLVNAQMDQRVMIGREDCGPWWLPPSREGPCRPAITLDQRGLRVAFRSVAGDVGPAFDVYAGHSDICIIDADGTQFATSILIAQRSSPVAPMKTEPAIQILAHRQESRSRKQSSRGSTRIKGWR